MEIKSLVAISAPISSHVNENPLMLTCNFTEINGEGVYMFSSQALNERLPRVFKSASRLNHSPSACTQ